MITIANIHALPTSPFEGSGILGIVITSGIPSYFRVIGSNLDLIKSINWYPEHPSTVQFKMRQLILVDNTEGTFMVRVTDNFLSTTDRGGRISFRLDDGATINMPVTTYGPVSTGALWQSPEQGLITG
jgi:hypothetical protein